MLIDEVTAIQHVFHPSAQATLAALSHGITVAQLYEHAVVQPVHVTEILGLCNAIGALKIDRSLHSRVSLFFKRWRDFLLGITYRSVAHRYQADLLGICMAVLQACQVLIAVSLVVSVFMGVAIPGTTSVIITACLWCLCMFISSIIAHEYGHASMLTRDNVAAVVLQRKSNVLLLHGKAESETRIALAGPFAGCLFLAVSWLGLSFFHVAYITQIILCIASTHCLSLTPFYADGKSLPYYQRLLRWRSL